MKNNNNDNNNNNNSNKNKTKGKIEFYKRIPLETIPNTFYAIFRNKRRSMAMLSGIVLSVTLLSGIFLYNAELKQNNYDGIVENYPYEVRFDIIGNETYSELSKLSNNISADSRVTDTTIMASEYSNLRNNWLDTYLIPKATDEIEEYMEVDPIFVDDDYFTGPIGETLLSMDFKGETDLTGQYVIISEQFMNHYGFKIGDTIHSINFTQNIYNDEVNQMNFGFLPNLTIRGSYKAILYEEFTMDIVGGSPVDGQKIYLSLDRLNDENMTEFNEGLHATGNFYVAVKIDVTQFNVGDPTTFNDELNQFINQITRDYDLDIQGFNMIEGPIMGFQFFSIFITILYVVLAIPVILLSLYLLNFGLEMSLEERRRLIAIKKVQGASSKQIFSELQKETVLLLIVGSVIGYLLGIIAAWSISSISGFMEIEFTATNRFLDFFRFDLWAFILPVGLVSLILIIVTYKKGKTFIDQEVTEGVSRREVKKEKFFKRNKLDVVLFVASLSGLVLVIIDLLKIQVQISGFTRFMIFLFMPFIFWIGGSSVGSRVVKWIPLKLEAIFLRLPVFRDVKNVIKSGLKRRGDIERLAVIIIMTLSIASLATIQGNTEETQAQRNIQWQIGADWQINFVDEGDFHETINNISGFEDSLAINQMYLRTLSFYMQLTAIENFKELDNMKNGTPIAMWQPDTFNTYTPQNALQALYDNSNGIFVSQDSLFVLDAKVGDVIDLRIPISESSTGETIKLEDIKILGIVNQLPGGTMFSAFISQKLFLEIQALSLQLDANTYENNTLNGTQYLVRTDKEAAITTEEIDQIQLTLNTEIDGVSSHRSYYEELEDINTTKEGYGITGLLSLNFIISLVAVLVSAFSFSAILMERRKHEFAILRSIGAKKSHIYKMALGENSLMMLTASIWGIFIGVGISYLFNGVFIFINMIVGGQISLNRTVVIPGLELVIISAVTFIGMMLATLLSVKSAANQDLSLATKVV